MKDAYYFSHDSNARLDQKCQGLIMELGYEGYGVYWAIIEMLRDATNYELETQYKRIAFALNCSSELVEKVINDHKLFTIEDDIFYSESLLHRMKIRENKSKKARESARKRWDKSSNNANALRTQSEGNAIKERKGKEIKVKEKKVNIDIFPLEKDDDPKIIISKTGLEQFRESLKSYLGNVQGYVWETWDNENSKNLFLKLANWLNDENDTEFFVFKRMYEAQEDFHAKNFSLKYFNNNANKIRSSIQNGKPKSDTKIETKDGYSNKKWERKANKKLTAVKSV